MTMSNSGSKSMQSEINVTPMIDVLLVLLIIFMVIVPIAPRGEAASVPQPATQAVPSPGNPVVLEILKGSEDAALFRINQQDVSFQDLRARLADIYANRAQRVLFIKADDQLSFRQIAEAVDISHAAGIDRVGFITPRLAQGL
ncbi:ExbD/TolR family protein [Occallatibacter riparius]|uniref:Biopolymer transporter ExbD n=1 Tax=Occallatibacter riparius TaxID=1002689 RepID=A0A9J7BY24_9BACT|nr:biopolymer transporter ExbD [Occallatibacter riparius]UWZ86229.1 biopolymer transporter ExbD [Occallatibacter riparius]